MKAYTLLILLCVLQYLNNDVLAQKGGNAIYIKHTEALNSESKKMARYTIFENSEASDSGLIGIEYHGNSTLLHPKKSYEFELRKDEKTEVKKSLFNMDYGDDFVLLSMAYDQSYLRNVLAQGIWSMLGHWTPEFRFIDVYINNNYQGLYMLIEKIKADPGRIEHKLKGAYQSDDFNKRELQYIIKLDRTKQYSFLRHPSSVSDEPIYFDLVYPKRRNLDFIARGNMHRDLINVESVLNPGIQSISPQNNLSHQDQIEDLIDLGSFSDYFLLSEASKNPDAYVASTYFARVKNNSSKIRKKYSLSVPAIWDFDLAFSNTQHEFFNSKEDWVFQFQEYSEDKKYMPTWWKALVCEEQFQNEFQSSIAKFEEILKTEKINKYLDSIYLELEPYIERDLLLWRQDSLVPSNIKNDHRKPREIAQSIPSQLHMRLKWMKENFNSILCVPAKSRWLEQVSHDTIHVKNNLLIRKLDPSIFEPTGGYYAHNPSIHYQLFDRKGEQILANKLHSSLKINMNDYPKGRYYLHLYDSGGTDLAISAVHINMDEYYVVELE